MTLQHCARQGILASFKKFLQGLRIGSQFAPVFVNSRSILKTSKHAKTAQDAKNTMKNIAVHTSNFLRSSTCSAAHCSGCDDQSIK